MPLRWFASIFAFLVLLSACETNGWNSRPEVDEETYVLLIAEFELLRHASEIRQQQQQRLILSEELPPEDLLIFAPEALKQDILEHYGISEAALRRAHRYYSQDISGQKRRYREAVDKVNEAHSQLSEAGKNEN